MAATSKLKYSPTTDLLEVRGQQLKNETTTKKEQIKALEVVSTHLAYEAGQMNQATLDAQRYLTKAPFQSPLRHRLQPIKTQNPLQQMQELLAMAKKVQSGVVDLELEGAITRLNEEIGRTNSLSHSVEDRVAQMERLIAQVRGLVEARRRNVAATKVISDELK